MLVQSQLEQRKIPSGLDVEGVGTSYFVCAAERYLIVSKKVHGLGSICIPNEAVVLSTSLGPRKSIFENP